MFLTQLITLMIYCVALHINNNHMFCRKLSLLQVSGQIHEMKSRNISSQIKVSSIFHKAAEVMVHLLTLWDLRTYFLSENPKTNHKFCFYFHYFIISCHFFSDMYMFGWYCVILSCFGLDPRKTSQHRTCEEKNVVIFFHCAFSQQPLCSAAPTRYNNKENLSCPCAAAVTMWEQIQSDCSTNSTQTGHLRSFSCYSLNNSSLRTLFCSWE